MAGDYLQIGFQADKTALRGLHRQIGDLIGTFIAFHDPDKGWPYSLQDRQEVKHEERYSFSTNAMIVFAVAAASALLDDQSVLLPVRRSTWDQDVGNESARLIGDSLVRFDNAQIDLKSVWGDKSPPTDRPWHIEGAAVETYSGTFGLNDPLTLTWMLGICQAVERQSSDTTLAEDGATSGDKPTLSPIPIFDRPKQDVTGLLSPLVKAADAVLNSSIELLNGPRSGPMGDSSDGSGPSLLQLEFDLRSQREIDTDRAAEGLTDTGKEGASPQDRRSSNARALPHTFLLLRCVHLAKVRSNHDGTPADGSAAGTFLRSVAVRQTFLDALHFQLSNHVIPGSPFDIGELVFALEGILQLDQSDDQAIQGVDPALVRRALEVVEESHRANPSWRPLRPFIVTSQGLSLLPVSVEVANSLLRIWRLLEPRLPTDSNVLAHHVGMFRRYEEWLRARQVWGKPKEPEEGRGKKDEAIQEFTGWHSEHRMVAGSIDLWETSQVLLFYVLYAELLQRHMASQAVLDAHLRISRPERKPKHKKMLEAEYWKSQCIGKKETLKGLGGKSPFRVFARIAEDFIEPWIDPDPRRRQLVSMLLYGPPGTGKTSIAKDVARTLRWPLIELSPSDFIAEGASMVEARAREIFDALCEQTGTVIFFDEIDRLILDRESSRYAGQGDMFQFMTPSMLTKFQDLHNAGRSIFIVGTNYGEHIDQAIKRTGRIDRQYLVPPPDVASREAILIHEVKDVLESRGRTTELAEKDIDVLRKAARATPLATYGELAGLVSEAFSDPDNKSVTDIVAMVRYRADGFSPAFSLDVFPGRFGLEGDTTKVPATGGQKPYNELFVTLYLLHEVAVAGLDDHAQGVMTSLRSKYEPVDLEWTRVTNYLVHLGQASGDCDVETLTKAAQALDMPASDTTGTKRRK